MDKRSRNGNADSGFGKEAKGVDVETRKKKHVDWGKKDGRGGDWMRWDGRLR